MSVKNRNRQRGAALLTAMLMAALVAITLTIMLQRQAALAGIEWQLRETAQARRILLGAEDLARQILRQDARRSIIDHLGEPWAIPLQEGRLADFLKSSSTANTNSLTDLDSSRVQDVWLSGRIVDADRRYNLMRLAMAGASAAQERALWLRIAANAGLPAELGQAVAERLMQRATENTGKAAAPIQPPISMAHLVSDLPALTPWKAALTDVAVILPEVTPINVNTASKPVLMALMPGLNDRQAERFMDLRSKAPWRDLNAINAAFTESAVTVDAAQAAVISRYFIVYAGVRLGDSAGGAPTTGLALTALVERSAQDMRTRVVRREFGAAY